MLCEDCSGKLYHLSIKAEDHLLFSLHRSRDPGPGDSSESGSRERARGVANTKDNADNCRLRAITLMCSQVVQQSQRHWVSRAHYARHLEATANREGLLGVKLFTLGRIRVGPFPR